MNLTSMERSNVILWALLCIFVKKKLNQERITNLATKWCDVFCALYPTKLDCEKTHVSFAEPYT